MQRGCRDNAGSCPGLLVFSGSFTDFSENQHRDCLAKRI